MRGSPKSLGRPKFEPSPRSRYSRFVTSHARATESPAQVLFGPSEWGFTALIAIIWGASFLFIRLGVESFGAGLVPLMRIAFGAMALALAPSARKPIARRDWPVVALLGLLWMAAPFLLFSIAEQSVPTAITGMINGAVPLSTAFVAAILHRRAPSPRRAVALLFGLVGVIVIALALSHDAASKADSAGVAMLFVGILCYGVSGNLSVPLQRRYGSLPVILRVQLVALVLSAPYGLYTCRTASFTWVGLGAMVVLGALGTGVAYAIAATLAGRTDATRGAIGVFLTPVVATLLGVLVRRESLPGGAFVGAGLVLVGAVLTSRPEDA